MRISRIRLFTLCVCHVSLTHIPIQLSLEVCEDDFRTWHSCHLSLQKEHNMTPPSLHRVLWGKFPCFLSTMERSDFLLPFSLCSVSFAQGYRCPLVCLLPCKHSGSSQGVQEWVSGSPGPASSTETTGPPRFLGNPHTNVPCSFRPRWDLDAMP